MPGYTLSIKTTDQRDRYLANCCYTVERATNIVAAFFPPNVDTNSCKLQLLSTQIFIEVGNDYLLGLVDASGKPVTEEEGVMQEGRRLLMAHHEFDPVAAKQLRRLQGGSAKPAAKPGGVRRDGNRVSVAYH